MLKKRGAKRPPYVYPADPWRLVEKRFYPKFLGQAETLFSVGNGYLGRRGGFEEHSPLVHSGTFINGLYESWPIEYPEEAYGFAKLGQTIVDLTDAFIVNLFIDDEPFELSRVEIDEYERALDMRHGRLERNVVWMTPSGKRARLRTSRLISFPQRHLAMVEYELTMLDAPAPVDIESVMRVPTGAGHGESNDPRKTRSLGERALVPVARYSRDLRTMLTHQTAASGLLVTCGSDHQLETECRHTFHIKCKEDEASLTVSVDAEAGLPIRLVKYISYHHERDESIGELKDRTHRTLDRAMRHGPGQIRDEQSAYLEKFWADSDIEVGHDEIQQAVRFNLFQILQASCRSETTGVPAKGLTGHGYEGHYFWDTEIYVLPFLIYTQPRIARNLLLFRYRCLEAARTRAREVSQQGALYPWRTINGEEASAYYAAGTAQYHINADIAYAIRKYVNATGDEEFLYGPGVEMLVETARLWLDLGFFSTRRDGRFCLVGVTGPDEYNTVVNNNTFTNLMARENLWYAAATVRHMRESRPDDYAALTDSTSLAPEEVDAWQDAADRMYLPFDEELGIYLQDDDFLDRKPWDLSTTPEDKFPLLLHYHPLVIYRHQVIKQADVVLAMFLLGDEFSLEDMKRTYDFYDPLTTGDSSLSVCIQGIVASGLGYRDKARDYAAHALLMDLDDVAGNVTDGCHIASMGGTWMAMAYGLFGFRDFDGRFSFKPLRPEEFHDACLRLKLPGGHLEVRLSRREVTYTLLSGEGLTFQHIEEPVTLTPESPVVTQRFREKELTAEQEPPAYLAREPGPAGPSPGA